MKIKKSLISGAAASVLLLSTLGTSAYANELITIDAEEIGGVNDEEIVVEENIANEETTVDDETSEEVETEKKATEEKVQEQEEAPALVPGDFFYFVKIMMEKVRLAVTFDDYKEARLLAHFAAERIAEANSLLAEGKADEATALIEEAINIQKKATDSLGESEEIADDETEVIEEATDETAVTEDQAAEEVPAEPTEGEDIAAKDEVEVKLAHNIDALAAALSHVKNPKAQLALKKNIQKSFAKLDKKLAKLEAKAGKFAAKTIEDDESVEEKPAIVTETMPTVEAPVKKATKETAVGEVVIDIEEGKEKVEEAVTNDHVKTVVAPGLAKKEAAKAKAAEKRAEGKAKAIAKKHEKRVDKQQHANVKKHNGHNKGAENKKNHGKGNE
ncbi:hypothetical protein J2Z40_003665 [Cytobacillus eiseniae]|uniref:DUF5667 domain-containing protein n=1 Tax=Cytobacillus eiseniae TaxID=762947 RepID=A0ABS4RMP9_9BACI|nr:DUF5667 domain-containing protein [Cytobacillus eiseniae]MBP2243077.1 hypothetical protein [Cytobacillus eiseniae]